MFWGDPLKKSILAIFLGLFFTTAAMGAGDEGVDTLLLPVGGRVVGYDMAPINEKTSHDCIDITTADDDDFPVGLINSCDKDMTITSIQLAEVTGKAPEWKDAPLRVNPRPAMVLDSAGGSCRVDISIWTLIGYFYTRSCTEIVLTSVNAIHIEAPPFKHLRVAGRVGKEAFEATAITIDVKDLPKTQKFRELVEKP